MVSCQNFYSLSTKNSNISMWNTSTSYLSNTAFSLLLLIILILMGAVLLFKKYYCEANCNKEQQKIKFYGYGDKDGPHTWEKNFELYEDESPSPIHLIRTAARVIPASCQPLFFSNEYHIPPQEMYIVNDGYGVMLEANWSNGERPKIYGGPLTEKYRFKNIRFRWGLNDFEGTEHMINNKKHAMELQVTYVNETCSCAHPLPHPYDPQNKGMGCIGCIVMVAYLFEVTPLDNPFFEPIIFGLRYIRLQCRKFNICPIPLSLIIPNFEREYYFYTGSLTYPPCTGDVKWIVLAETLNISSRQVEKFRELWGPRGYILSNIRPLQNINERDICFFV